jgi:hypothetical protein
VVILSEQNILSALGCQMQPHPNPVDEVVAFPEGLKLICWEDFTQKFPSLFCPNAVEGSDEPKGSVTVTKPSSPFLQMRFGD